MEGKKQILTKISKHWIAAVHLDMLVLVEDVLVNSSTAKQKNVAVIRDGTFC